MKRTSIQRISEPGFRHLAQAAETLANAEGLAGARPVRSIRRGEWMTDNRPHRFDPDRRQKPGAGRAGCGA
jgi:hypothetical protein